MSNLAAAKILSEFELLLERLEQRRLSMREEIERSLRERGVVNTPPPPPNPPTQLVE